MDINKLCEMSLEELDKMSMSQLEEYFRPFWPTTRPERKQEVSSGVVSKGQVRSSGPTSKRTGGKATDPELLKLQARLSPEQLKFMRDNGLIK